MFDLDNTLYSPEARIFDQINRRMTDFIMQALSVAEAEADHLRRDLWARHGTTMAGLAAEHGVAPEAFLDAAHQLDLSVLTPDRALAEAVSALPGRVVVHTNAPRAHAERVIAARGLDGCFEAIVAIEDTGLASKPTATAFERAMALLGYDPSQTAMIEDHAENLMVPRAMGMATVWLDHGPPTGPPAHVDHHIDDLNAFLRRIADPAPA